MTSRKRKSTEGSTPPVHQENFDDGIEFSNNKTNKRQKKQHSVVSARARNKLNNQILVIKELVPEISSLDRDCITKYMILKAAALRLQHQDRELDEKNSEIAKLRQEIARMTNLNAELQKDVTSTPVTNSNTSSNTAGDLNHPLTNTPPPQQATSPANISVNSPNMFSQQPEQAQPLPGLQSVLSIKFITGSSSQPSQQPIYTAQEVPPPVPPTNNQHRSIEYPPASPSCTPYYTPPSPACCNTRDSNSMDSDNYGNSAVVVKAEPAYNNNSYGYTHKYNTDTKEQYRQMKFFGTANNTACNATTNYSNSRNPYNEEPKRGRPRYPTNNNNNNNSNYNNNFNTGGYHYGDASSDSRNPQMLPQLIPTLEPSPPTPTIVPSLPPLSQSSQTYIPGYFPPTEPSYYLQKQMTGQLSSSQNFKLQPFNNTQPRASGPWNFSGTSFQ